MKIKKGDTTVITINIILLLVTLISSNMIVNTTFNILDYKILASVFTFPFVFYFGNKILKVVNKKLFFDIIIGIVFLQVIVFYIMFNDISYANFASVIAFFIAQMVNMFLFDKNLKKESDSFGQIILTYGLVIIIDAILFSFFMGSVLSMALLYSIIIKLIIGLILSIIDYNIIEN